MEAVMLGCTRRRVLPCDRGMWATVSAAWWCSSHCLFCKTVLQSLKALICSSNKFLSGLRKLECVPVACDQATWLILKYYTGIGKGIVLDLSSVPPQTCLAPSSHCLSGRAPASHCGLISATICRHSLLRCVGQGPALAQFLLCPLHGSRSGFAAQLRSLRRPAEALAFPTTCRFTESTLPPCWGHGRWLPTASEGPSWQLKLRESWILVETTLTNASQETEENQHINFSSSFPWPTMPGSGISIWPTQRVLLAWLLCHVASAVTYHCAFALTLSVTHFSFPSSHSSTLG